MSYCRNPHYIYPTRDGVQFDNTFVEDSALDIWLYNMLLKNRREELVTRLKHGKECELQKYDLNFNIIPEDNIEIVCDKKFQEMNEDGIIKILMNK